MRVHLMIGVLALAAACGGKDDPEVPNEPPAVAITFPSDGAAVLSEAPITLALTASDRETPSQDLELVVQSDVVGPLLGDLSWVGDQATLALADGLPAGTHVVTARVVDEAGAEATDVITVDVRDNLPPTVSLVSPADLEKVAEGRLVRVEATFDDDRDDPSELTLEWTGVGGIDDAPVHPESSGSVVFYLDEVEVGQHVLTVRVSDTQGATASASLEFEVVPDNDGDGFVSADSGGDDCDDTDPAVRPDATELCDGIDNDCDGAVDEDDAADATVYYADVDRDGYGDAGNSRTACALPAGYVETATDCDDLRDHSHPGADELCDTFDNDCDGAVDESDSLDALTWFADLDGDGFGDPDAPTRACEAPSDHVADDQDCDDADSEVRPGAVEVCNDVDDDCDGDVDDAAADALTFYADADLDTFGDAGAAIRACDLPVGYVEDDADCDDADGRIHPGATEVCDGVDNDCDFVSDEPDAADAVTWYLDADKDGYGDAAASTTACEAPSGYLDDDQDCDDGDSAIHPGADEVCDGADNDCDLSTDEDDAIDAETWFADTDSDGHGDPDDSTTACSAPSGYVASDDDCDDTSATTYAGASEVCDGEDNDCDAVVDEDATDAVTWYLDDDGDGYGLTGSTAAACEAPTGYASADGDCDDEDDAVNPGASEVCNGIDDDCNSSVDDSAVDAVTYFLDADGDGYGIPSTTTTACTLPDGYAETSDDCDDASDTTFPGAPELCDSKDNDCDASVDEDKPVWYRDADRDGYGTDKTTTESCSMPTGYVKDAGDCNDTASSVYPGASERCNLVDDDCDGSVDEDAADAEDYYVDDDGDGFGDASGTATRSCSAVDGHVVGNTDCDDADTDVYPGAPELCDGIDNDCDSATETALEVPGTYTTIKAAIAAASDGDSVCLAAGTYYETIDYDGKAIVIDGKAGADKVILDGGGGGPVVTIDNRNLEAVLANVTVTGGDAGQGAGIYVFQADPTFVHVIVEDNACTGYTGCRGTGIYVNDGDVTLRDVVIRDNVQTAGGGATASFRGAGLYTSKGSVVLRDVLVEDNEANATANGTSYNVSIYGAGLDINQSAIDFEHVDAVHNLALASGSSSSSRSRSIYGAGMSLSSVTGSAQWVRIVDNRARARLVYGIGLRVDAATGETVTLTNVVVGGNESSGRSFQVSGGGVYAQPASGSAVDFVNADIVANVVNVEWGYGIGINANSNVELRNVNLAYNDATYVSGVGGSDGYGGFAAYYTNFYDNQPSSYAQASSYTSIRGNKALSPGFTDITPVFVDDWDLELNGSSPVRNLGDPAMEDPDGSRAGIGAYSGPDADGW